MKTRHYRPFPIKQLNPSHGGGQKVEPIMKTEPKQTHSSVLKSIAVEFTAWIKEEPKKWLKIALTVILILSVIIGLGECESTLFFLTKSVICIIVFVICGMKLKIFRK